MSDELAAAEPPTPPVALAATGSAVPATADGAVGFAVPRLRRLGAVRVGPLGARVAFGLIVLLTLLVVAFATSGPTVLVPRSGRVFPGWEAGPLGFVTVRPFDSASLIGALYTGVLIVMLIAYGVTVTAVRSLSLRLIVIGIVLLHVILVLSPPLQLTDMFNYLGYARLGGLHHLSPYTHGISAESFDPVFRLSSWHDLRSPYGELFTALTYLVAALPLGLAFWIVKVVTVLLSLGFLALVALCARKLGRDPRFALVFCALNPVYLLYGVAGFHNDFFMLVPSMAAIALMLSGRDRWSGAMVTVAVAVKFTALIIGPFLLLAAVTRPRQRRLIEGAVIAAVPLLVLSLALFGLHLPNLQQQSTLLTDFSIPNLVGLIFGVGGSALMLKLAEVALIAVVARHFFARRSDWLTGAGWSTFALILSLAWAVPWYVIWLLPLAALSQSVALRRWAVVLTAFLMLAFVPVTTSFLNAHHSINPLGTPAGRASQNLQNRLAN